MTSRSVNKWYLTALYTFHNICRLLFHYHALIGFSWNLCLRERQRATKRRKPVAKRWGERDSFSLPLTYGIRIFLHILYVWDYCFHILLIISASTNEQGDRPTQILKKLIQWKELYHALGLEPYGSWLGQPFRL